VRINFLDILSIKLGFSWSRASVLVASHTVFVRSGSGWMYICEFSDPEIELGNY
jgi:hypothetical protein